MAYTPDSNVPTVITAMLGANAILHGISSWTWIASPDSFLRQISAYYGEPVSRIVESTESAVGEVIPRSSWGWQTSTDLLRLLGGTNAGLFFLSGWNLYKYWKTNKLSEGGLWALSASSLSRFVVGLSMAQGANWKQELSSYLFLDLLSGITAAGLGIYASNLKIQRKQWKHKGLSATHEEKEIFGRGTSEASGTHPTAHAQS